MISLSTLVLMGALITTPTSGAAPPSLLPEGQVTQPSYMANEYYVTGRYNCLDNSDNSDRGSCDLTTYASSCQAALEAHNAEVRNRGDICRRCTLDVTDNTKHYSGKMEWIHLGPCRGFPN